MAIGRRVITDHKQIFGADLALSGYSDDDYYASLVQGDDIRDEDVLLALKAATATGAKDMTVLDVGANIGYVSCALAKTAPQATIHAFEPVPSNVKVLEKNIADNNVKNVQAHAVGLGKEKLSTQIVWSPENRGGAFITDDKQHEAYTESEPVTVERFDDIHDKLGISSAQLIKLDIEGYELDFLAGAKQFITKHHPILVVEANAWCLDGLRGISLPQFLDEVEKLFPYMHAFWGKEVIDVVKHREVFMHENLVHNRFMNMLCSSDAKLQSKLVAVYEGSAKHLDYRQAAIDDATQLRQENDKLWQEKQALEGRIRALDEQVRNLQRPGIKASSKALAKAVSRKVGR